MGIYVWGTGCGASELIEQGLDLAQITAFVDSFSEGTYLGLPVILPEDIPAADCSLLIITTRMAEAVAQQCSRLGIPEEKLLFLKNNHILLDRNKTSIAREVLGSALLEKLLPVPHTVSTPAQLTRHVLPDRELTNDYVRLATLELLCRQLKDIPGAAAELGVYRGHFAKCINALLPDRTLYLFDSFEGFSADANAAPAFQESHANTSVQAVLDILPHPEMAVVKPGFFPDSLDGLEDAFCLVSLDVDFYQATLAGLRYFWPRLEPGGYLMLHDWGSPRLPGVKQALADFQEEIGKRLPCVPLCDIGGSLVLCK